MRFFVLMIFATVIASGGIIADSTATLIGAMLIAPLMTPIVATTAALIMGNSRRALSSIGLVAAGVAFVISVSLVLSFIAFKVINFEANTQIASRVQPSMLDLIVALAAGAAGAFAMSRDDVADSLPGVAISIALVPPLCVVGIALGNGEWTDANGAFILFLTNCLSILLAGGGVFGLLHLQKASTEDMGNFDRRKVYQIIILGIVLVTIPLAITTVEVARDSFAQVQVRKAADEWIDQFEQDYIIDSIMVRNNVARIVITGPEAPESASSLMSQIRNDVEALSRVKLLFVPSKAYGYDRTAPEGILNP